MTAKITTLRRALVRRGQITDALPRRRDIRRPNRSPAPALAPHHPVPMPDADDALPFEALMARLDALATRLEDPALRLDEALALYEEGTALARQGLDRLRDAEARVQTLSLE